MYAIIETGGKQYRVENGDQITVEKLKAADGETIVFDKVLVVGDGANAKVGAPYVDGVTVEGKVIETGKGKKIVIFKYKAKKDYRKKQGHRQPYTLVEITSIDGDKTVSRKAEEKAKTEPKKAAKASAEKKDAPKAQEKKAEEKAPVKEEKKPEEKKPEENKPAKKPSLKSMKKAQLIEFAKENSIEIDEKATNAVMIETIEAALK